jgi:hypothetical protein
MNERDFYYWLRGYFELTETDSLTSSQVAVIKEHMDLVAKKVTSLSVKDKSTAANRRELIDVWSVPAPRTSQKIC